MSTVKANLSCRWLCPAPNTVTALLDGEDKTLDFTKRTENCGHNMNGPLSQRSQGLERAPPHLELPEDASSVAVVVMPQGNVLQALTVCLQVVLHVLEEPRLVVTANAIQLQ